MPGKCSVCFLLVLAAGTIERPTEGWADRPAVKNVSIVVSNEAAEPIRIAADELARSLHRLYPDTGFRVTRHSVLKEAVIYVGTPAALPQLAMFCNDKRLSHSESYIVTAAQIEGRKCGIIVGSDSAGVVYGVYGLLKRLGYGFYLSCDTVPVVSEKTFAFDHWDVADYPLVPNRIVFDWHNFLSGCSTWNLADWQSWIIQSQKMGYNAIMVHAYGNNPMAGFQFAGEQKPVGYLSSTRVGRDWSTNHVNDVRRLWGGDVFAEPVFGSVAAIKGTDMVESSAKAAGERVFDVTISLSGTVCHRDRVDIFQRTGGSHRVLRIAYPVELTKAGGIDVSLVPVKGKALICGVKLEPIVTSSSTSNR